MSVFTNVLSTTEIALKFILFVLLLRGPFKKYLAFSLYILAGLIVDPMEIVAYYRLGWRSDAYHTLFWSDHIVLDLFLFLVVIACTYDALGESKRRAVASKALGCVMAIAILLPIAMLPYHHGKHGHFSSQWFSHTRQIMNFGAALMNLVLWTALLTNRKRDPKLLTLSIGLGIVTTAAAIAWGARELMSAEHRWTVDAFLGLANIASLVLWCWVFKPKTEANNRKPLPPTAPPSAPPADALTNLS